MLNQSASGAQCQTGLARKRPAGQLYIIRSVPTIDHAGRLTLFPRSRQTRSIIQLAAGQDVGKHTSPCIPACPAASSCPFRLSCAFHQR